MFNVCPGCGEYADDREILHAPERALCATCGYEHEFLSLPLYVVTGASGSGKSTVALELVDRTSDFVVLDQDILWNDAFNKPDDDYRLFRNTWLRMVKNIHQNGKPVVLFGSVTPGQYEACAERRYVGDIHYLGLICDPEELERRLRQRPGWRKSGDATNLQNMLNFNNWIIENAEKSEPKIALVDTTRVALKDTVSSILSWIQDHV